MCVLSVYAYVRNVYLWYMYLYARLLGISKGGWMGREGYTVYVCVCVCMCVCVWVKLLCIQCMCVQITACYMY